jgi:hypothetical protein
MAVLALLLGAVVGLLAGVATSAWRSRRRVAGLAQSFRCRLRVVDREEGASAWCAAHAAWVHDVLLIGAAPRGTVIVPVLELDACQVSEGAFKGLGPYPEVVRLRLDDDRLVEVAAAAGDAEKLAGPFLALPAARGMSPA